MNFNPALSQPPAPIAAPAPAAAPAPGPAAAAPAPGPAAAGALQDRAVSNGHGSGPGADLYTRIAKLANWIATNNRDGLSLQDLKTLAGLCGVLEKITKDLVPD